MNNEKLNWSIKLFQWADKNNIPNKIVPDLSGEIYHVQYIGIPRNEELLLDITSLDLSGYNLKELPNEIENLVNLKAINISHNQFQSIPECIYNLKKLEFLNIAFNQITVVEKEICNLSKLYRVDIYENNIKSYPCCLQEKLYFDEDRWSC